MSYTGSVSRGFISVGVPLLIIGMMVWVVKSSWFVLNPEILSLGVTADLLLTSPVIYFLLIRKTSIPKSTVVPVFIAGVLAGSFILPPENQYFLNLVKTWFLPILETSILILITLKVRKIVKSYRTIKTTIPDFFAALNEACSELFPRPLVSAFATEIAVVYYGFSSWKRRIPSQNEFTYHKNSGIIPVLVVIIFLVIIETLIVHLVLARWSSIAAWILTGLSIYTVCQLVGFLRSMTKRFISIDGDTLNLRYGILSEASFDIRNIAMVEITSKQADSEVEIRKFSPFGELESHNLILRMSSVQKLTGMYGIKRKFKNLALHVDDPQEFKIQVENIRSAGESH